MKSSLLNQAVLNRTFLQRQLLLDRQTMAIPTAMERLVGLQSQVPNPPYIGLWTRLAKFQRQHLTELIQQQQIVRGGMMRSTLHLMTAQDYLQLRLTIQPALVKGLRSFFGKGSKTFEVNSIVKAARAYLEKTTATTGEQREFLLTIAPQGDSDAMAYAIRAYLPLIQVPPRGIWGSGSIIPYTLADVALGQPLAPENLRYLFFRYLAAFGPASIMDFQAWAGMTNLKGEIENFRNELRVYQTEDGKDLFDLPELTLVPEETPPPVRFIPEYDNLVLAHANRTRIIPLEAYRPKIFLSAARVRSTFLIDGFVRGVWKVEKNKQRATLIIEPFIDLSDLQQTMLAEEGAQLLRFIEPDAESYEIRFSRPDL